MAARRPASAPTLRSSVDRRAAADAIDAFLRAIGRSEPSVVGTGARVADMFVDDLCIGYEVDTRKLIEDSVIDARARTSPTEGTLVLVRDIPVVTTCPHHLIPSVGAATVAFKAKGRLVGLGTITTLVDVHARRLALQEDIGENVVDDLEAVLAP